ncbi:hypothetical protein QVD17_23055 [Tagetes erecta]|uniref:Myb-like domain-containing protein n=1 Tax=Tagetes erecta TaxID=13708 RepID=A0AAD8KIJ6_TARER|nr:hypothetical protein QVD17_23055 [Tagetes erecta]
MDAPRRSTSRGGSQKRSGRGRGTGLSRGSGSNDPPPYFPQMHQQQPQFPMMQSAPGHQFNYSLQDDWSFDPFGARFNTPQPRDQYSQGSRANYIDYNDYNDYEAEENQDVVPETQQFQNIHVDDDDDDDQEENLAGERAKKVQKFAGRAERQIWTPNQEENLAKAWVHISVDKKVGNQQPRDGFWKRVLKHYATLEGGSTRTHHQLNSKWTSLNTKLAAFNSTYINAARVIGSGGSDKDVLMKALSDYQTRYKTHFSHIKAWDIVKTQPKWLEQPMLDQISSSSSRKRKSTDSENASTNDDAHSAHFPDLNEDATPPPPHRHKGKSKKGGESSSHGGWLDKFTSYTSNKSDWLKNFVTSATKKHERSVKLMDTQERICLEEEYDNDLKKFTKSHDHLSGDMLELVLARKREIAAKHGWTCNF